MTPEECLKQSDPGQALSLLSEQVRDNPGDALARVFLAQLLCVTGEWSRALAQFQVAAELDPAATLMRMIYSDAVRCEVLRAEVMAGRKMPMVLGQPPQWLVTLLQALTSDSTSGPDAPAEIVTRALGQAPATRGSIDDEPFEWIADADVRYGPVFEAFVNGRYYWIPMERLARVEFDAPADLRDLVWQPARLRFANGGETVGLIPVRYPGSEREAGPLQMARRTEWREIAPGMAVGLGQRVLATDRKDHALLDVRTLVFECPPAEADHAT